MNRHVTYILVGGASALIGAIAGYFFCKKRTSDIIEDEVSRRVNEELSSIREGKMKKKSEKQEQKEPINIPFEEISKEEIDSATDLVYEMFPGYDLNPYRVSLLASRLAYCKRNNLSEKETDDLVNELIESFDEDQALENEIQEASEPQMVMSEYENKPPEVIPLADYRNLPPYFEFVTYTYFEDDDVLLDDGEEIIDDVEHIVGDALLHFDEEEDDGDCVYVINGSMGLAIEIERRHASYAEYMGLR